MFNPGDIVQVIGDPPRPWVEPRLNDGPPLPLHSIHEVLHCHEVNHPRLLAYILHGENWFLQVVGQPDDKLWFWAYGFRLISRPDPLLAEREASVPVVNFTTEPA